MKSIFLTLIVKLLPKTQAGMSLTADMLMHSPLRRQIECYSMNSPICLNSGLCVDWGRLLLGGYMNHEECICQPGFYGPRCEYVDEHYRSPRGIYNQPSTRLFNRINNISNKHSADLQEFQEPSTVEKVSKGRRIRDRILVEDDTEVESVMQVK